MYWKDNELEEKRRIEQEQRARKKERSSKKVAPAPLPPLEPAVVIQSEDPPKKSISEAIESSEELKKALDIISQQNSVAREQSNQISALTDVLKQQQKIVDSLVQKGVTIKVAGNRQVVTEDDDLPILEDVDIPVVNTKGIEIGHGQAGERKVSSGKINSKVERLKKLKRGT